MGIPFYGRSFAGVPDSHHRLFESFDSGSARTHDDIKANVEADADYVDHWHHDTKQSYLYLDADGEFVAYDDKAGVQNKLNHIKDNDFRPVM